jgi:3-hydroxybutyryl-CoA dehydrogenase
MGAGIVQAFAAAGHDVRLLDVKDRSRADREATFDEVREELRSKQAFLVEAGRSDVDGDAVLENVTFSADADAALTGADWVFEALPEEPEIKREFLSTAGDALPAEAIVATTTSSISLDTLVPAVDRRERLLITHWLNPAFIVPLVEVARAEYTDDRAVEATVELLDGVGKEPVVCSDSPGFVGSRIQAAAMNEAVRVWEEDVASAAEIDRALQSGVGLRMAAIGLLEFVDLGGVDILYYVDEYLREELGPRFEPPESVVEKMENDDLGPKTGRGYYDYEDGDAAAVTDEYHRALLAVRDALADADR